MTDPSAQIENLRERIKAGGLAAISDNEEDAHKIISEADQEVLLDFSDEVTLRSSDYSDHRHVKLLRHCTIASEEVGGLADALVERDATEDIVRWINRTYNDSEETNSDYRTAIRVFGKRVVEASPDRLNPDQIDKDGYPRSIAWIPSGTSSTYDPAPDPAKMLRWETEVVPMIEATQNARDAAMIAFLFDVGPRGGEFMDLEYGSFSDGQFGLQVTVHGKRGQRTVAMVPSVPYVQDWRASDHPAPDDPTAPLWCHLNSPKELSPRMIYDALEAAARRVDVTKPVTPTNFRKSSAAHLASKGMNQAHLEDHHGWVRGSKAAARYISIFAPEAERETARVWGKEVPVQDDDTIAPLDCPRCGNETPREKPLCMWCGQALEPDAAQKAERVDEAFVRAIADATGEKAESLVDARQRTRNDPEALADLVAELAPMFED